MSGLSQYLKKNKKVRENLVIAPTKSLLDENGEPVKFTFRPISTAENDEIRDSCVKTVGKKSDLKTKIDNTKYMKKLLAISCVEPNLDSVELQDSYDVSCAEDLICEIIDNPGEYNELVLAVMEYNGFTGNDDVNKVDEVKN